MDLKRKERWQDWGMLALGAWLFFSPFFMPYASLTDAAAWNAYLVGGAVVLFAISAIYAPETWQAWVNLVLGGWLVFVPFLFGFYGAAQAAAWNSVLVGLLIVADAIWTIATRQPPGEPAHHH